MVKRRFWIERIEQEWRRFEATRFAAPCEVSGGAITNYLSVLEGACCGPGAPTVQFPPR